MVLDPDSVKSQLTDLFKKTDNHSERIAALEIMEENQKNMIVSVNKSTQVMEKWVADAHMILYGCQDKGVIGLVKQHNKMWVYTQRAIIAGMIGLWFLKEFGILTKLAI